MLTLVPPPHICIAKVVIYLLVSPSLVQTDMLSDSRVLQRAEIESLDGERCVKELSNPDFSSEKQICAGGTRG